MLATGPVPSIIAITGVIIMITGLTTLIGLQKYTAIGTVTCSGFIMRRALTVIAAITNIESVARPLLRG